MNLDRAREVIRQVIAEHETPIVACSFGKESVLLLSLVREQIPDVPVIWLRENLLRTQREFAERLIVEWGLTVFGFAPTHVYLMPAPDGKLSLISEYGLNGEHFPVVRDLVAGDRCLLKFPTASGTATAFPFDSVLIGWKDCDTHPIFGRAPYPPDGTLSCGTRFYAPLRHLSDDQVWQAIRDLDIPYNQAKYDARDDLADPDCVVACARCLEGSGRVFCPDVGRQIDSYEWDRGSLLQAFRSRFGLT